ncbi:MAG TPA: ATP F0F1 synthase subunit B [Xanthobacteraceae bacterium]
MLDAEFWVAAAFALFVGLLVYLGVHERLIRFVDRRRNQIRAELDEARALKLEAQALLAQSEGKRRAAEHEASAVIAAVNAESERMLAEARIKMRQFVVRRTGMAEARIARAEAQALADVRGAAAAAAVNAAERILAATVKGEIADRLVRDGIDELRTKLN